jgi:hypothetical protein
VGHPSGCGVFGALSHVAIGVGAHHTCQALARVITATQKGELLEPGLIRDSDIKRSVDQCNAIGAIACDWCQCLPVPVDSDCLGGRLQQRSRVLRLGHGLPLLVARIAVATQIKPHASRAIFSVRKLSAICTLQVRHHLLTNLCLLFHRAT